MHKLMTYFSGFLKNKNINFIVFFLYMTDHGQAFTMFSIFLHTPTWTYRSSFFFFFRSSFFKEHFLLLVRTVALDFRNIIIYRVQSGLHNFPFNHIFPWVAYQHFIFVNGFNKHLLVNWNHMKINLKLCF